MYALSRAPAFTAGGSGTNTILTPPQLTPGTLLALAVGMPTAQAVSSITVTTGTGTFSPAGTAASTNYRLEMWMGFNFTGYPAGVSINFVTSNSFAVSGRAIDVSADLSSAPTLATSAANTGTSTTVDTNFKTPVVGDLLLAGAVWAGTSPETATASTGNNFTFNQGAAGSTFWVSLAVASAMNAVPSKLVYTITSGEWTAMLSKLSASDRAATAALITKGRPTAALDANPGA